MYRIFRQLKLNVLFINILKESVNFDAAKRRCAFLCGKLVTPKNSGENDHLFKIVTQNDMGNVWLGISDEISEGNWLELSSSQQILYTNWIAGQPDGGTSQNHAFLDINNAGQWRDNPKSTTASVVCEL